MSKKIGYRKDGKERRPLTMLVTQESIDEAVRIHGAVSLAFELAYAPKRKK